MLAPADAGQRRRIVGRGFALALLLVCGLLPFCNLLLALLPLDLPLIWLASEAGDSARSSLFTAISMLLLGGALLSLDVTTRRGHHPAQWLALTAIVLEIFVIATFSFESVPRFGRFQPVVKPHSALIVCLLSWGTLMARRPASGLVSRLQSTSSSGLLLRQLLPYFVLVPIALGTLKIWGQNAGLVSEPVGDALVSLAMIGLFAALLWKMSGKLESLDLRRSEAEALFQCALETASDGIIVSNEQRRIILANQQMEKMFGYGPDELLGKELEILLPEALRAVHAGHQQRYFARPRALAMGRDLSITGRRKDGSLFPVEISLGTQRRDGRLVVTAIIRDVSERLRRNEALKRRDRALIVLSRGNQALLHCTNELELLDAMCRVAVEEAGYRTAWVGYKREDAAQSVQPMAWQGIDTGWLKEAVISWGDNDHGQGPTGLAIRSGQVQVARDISSVATVAGWREKARSHGFAAITALPLRASSGVFGALIICADQQDAFDESEVSLLREMAEDLSFGIATLRNNEARIAAENSLKSSLSLLESTLEATADGILVTALNGDTLRYNHKFVTMWGLSPATSEASRHLWRQVVELVEDGAAFARNSEASFERPELSHRDVIALKDGRVFERVIQPHRLEGRIVGRVCSLRDVTAQKRHESALTYLANHDGLTGLPNRNLLNDRLKQALALAGRSGTKVALLFLDLDRFKLVNDSLGHEFGDLVLSEAAKRLSGCVREGDTLARMGGDEFVVLLPNMRVEEDIVAVASKLLTALATPYRLEDRELLLGGSIGVALYPRDGTDAVTLLKRADAAMYRAKEHGGAFRFYTEDIDALAHRHLEIASQLQFALERNEFTMHYQPLFDVRSGGVIGAEALIRWNHPRLGMVSPTEFIPVAEESHLILAISSWVADSVFAQCRAWREAGLPLERVAINLPARQLDLPDLPEVFSQLLDKHGLRDMAPIIELEITEGMMMHRPEQAIRTLDELKAMNFSVSVDDFGTGYSSLAYLKRLPIDKLKIDRLFIKDVPRNAEDVAIVRGVIAMAHELGLVVVAEGVEEDAQRDFLHAHGCDAIQGYLLGKPMPAEQFTGLFENMILH